jgi:hypothetical protein
MAPCAFLHDRRGMQIKLLRKLAPRKKSRYHALELGLRVLFSQFGVRRTVVLFNRIALSKFFGDSSMIEQYLRRGIVVRWNKPANSNGPLDGAIVNSVGAATPMIYEGLVGHREALDPTFLISQPSTRGYVMHAPLPSQYTWLDYAPGRTARVNLGGADVLTGYMSGCLIARGTFNGVMSAFHLGTIENPAVNTLIKQTFRAQLPNDVTGFYPAAAWTVGERTTINSQCGGSGTDIIALVTTTGAFYSIVLCHTRVMGEEVIGGIKQVPALDRSALLRQLGGPVIGSR